MIPISEVKLCVKLKKNEGKIMVRSNCSRLGDVG